MPPPPARIKADDDDIFGDAGTDYICELPKVQAESASLWLSRSLCMYLPVFVITWPNANHFALKFCFLSLK